MTNSSWSSSLTESSWSTDTSLLSGHGLCANRSQQYIDGQIRPCCPGQDDQCSIDAHCFCDEACITFDDCCSDYEVVCSWINGGSDNENKTNLSWTTSTTTSTTTTSTTVRLK